MTALPDPWAVLAALPEITLGEHELHGALGLYFDDLKTIILATGLLQVQRRCTLAHELAHFRLGHTACADRRSARRQEVEAEVIAARWLIPLEALVRARLATAHPAELADELWVDVPLLDARLASLTRDEERTLEQRVRACEGAA